MKHTVNPDKIKELKEIDDDGELLRELIELFVPSTEKKIDLLSGFSSGPVAADIRPIAHEMRSSSANLGAENLSELATLLEYLPVDSTYQVSVCDIVSKMKEEFEAVKKELKAYL